MIIFANKKIRNLFISIAACTFIFTIVSIFLVKSDIKNASIFMAISCIAFGMAVLLLCYRFFVQQNRIMEDAVLQIRQYISGDRTVSINCNDEGELYRLFHEVNSLVGILNAQADNEKSSKKFLHDTISDISHQLKTPLAALNIYNGILEGEAEDNPQIAEFVKLSENELDRIEILVQNLLKISKLDSGKIVFEKVDENVYELASNVLGHFEVRARQEDKKLSLSGDKDITLKCDHNWMIEAISNLIKNSLDHTDKGDSIDVEVRRFASIVQIIVKDNGSGIHTEDMPFIFKRFYRSRFSQDKQGIGLGLPLTKSIVEAHNGTIEVDSTLGIGTSFTMNFLIPTKL